MHFDSSIPESPPVSPNMDIPVRLHERYVTCVLQQYSTHITMYCTCTYMCMVCAVCFFRTEKKRPGAMLLG